jgi:ribosome-binding protein aMBF1 (putative translation factor)
MKNCKICNHTKPLSEFYTHSRTCKSCTLASYHANKVLKGYTKHQPKELPPERTCKLCGHTLPISEFHVSKPAPGRLSPKISTKCKSCTKLDYLANREAILARASSKRVPKPKPPKKTPEETRARVAAYKKHKRNTNPLFRLRSNVGTLIANALSNQGYKKTAKSAEILGCTFEQFKLHIEHQFTVGMSWDNRSEWHIDHKIPLSKVDLQDIKQFCYP